MKFTVLQENVKNIISLTSHFTSPKAQLPILSNILLRVDKKSLTLSATNLETSIQAKVAAKVETEGEITVNGRTLNDLIQNLSSGNIEFELDKEHLIINSGSFKSKLLGINSNDFPKIPGINEKSIVKLNANDFITSLAKVLGSVSLDESRPILTGVLFILKEKKLYLVSTDGFRLSEVKLKVNETKSELKLIIPKAILNELVKIETKEEVEMSYDKDNNQIVFRINDITLSSRVIEGEFPDYEKIIPTASISTFYVSKDELLKAIKLASVFARDSGKILKLDVKNQKLAIKAESSTSGNQETELEIRRDESEIESKEINIMFNYSFIEDFLRIVEDDEIKIEISDNNKASKFLDPKSPDLLHIIMPIKTN